MLVLWFFCYFDLPSKLCAKWKVIILDLVADVNKCNCYFVLLFMGLWINDCEWLIYLLHPAEFFRFVWNLLFFGSDIVTKYSIASLCGPPSSRLCCIFPSISPSVCICILRVFTRTNWQSEFLQGLISRFFLLLKFAKIWCTNTTICVLSTPEQYNLQIWSLIC